jgi:hypothetical protein
LDEGWFVVLEYFRMLDESIDALRIRLSKELTLNLRVAMKASGAPVADYRVMAVDEDFNVVYPRSAAKRISDAENGLGYDDARMGAIHRFQNRVDDQISALLGKGIS